MVRGQLARCLPTFLPIALGRLRDVDYLVHNYLALLDVFGIIFVRLVVGQHVWGESKKRFAPVRFAVAFFLPQVQVASAHILARAHSGGDERDPFVALLSSVPNELKQPDTPILLSMS